MRYRSKALATWLALLTGCLGIHRLYVHGLRDKLAWLHVVPTLTGLVGVQRMRQLGQDDQMAWLLIPLLGLMLSQAALVAIVWGLTPDAQWDRRFNPGQPSRSTRWAPVLGAVFALLVGGTALMGTIAFSGQKFFEWYLEAGSVQNSQKLRP
jgi:hypothetical protein